MSPSLELPFPFYNYDPYTKQYLGFTVETQNVQHRQPGSSSIVDTVTTKNDHQDISFLYDVDMYSQPVLPPILALFVVPLIQIILVTSAIFIQFRTLQMLRKEKSVNNAMMTTQAKIHIFFWPVWFGMITLTENLHPLGVLFTPIVCHIFRFYFYFGLFSFILYSFYASLLRYLCCLHSQRVNSFGREKLIKIVYCVFYLHTLLWSVYTITTSFSLDHTPVINRCFGEDINIFLIENNPSSMIRRHFCASPSAKGMLNLIFMNWILRFYHQLVSIMLYANMYDIFQKVDQPLNSSPALRTRSWSWLLGLTSQNFSYTWLFTDTKWSKF